MSNPKSLLIPGDFPPVVSGIATYFHEIWKYFPAEECYILAPRVDGWEEFDANSPLHIIRKRIPTGDSMKAKILKGILHSFWAFVLHLRYRFDAIHCGQVLSSGVTGWLLKKLCAVPYFVYVYGSETFRFGHSRLLRSAITSFLRNADRIVPNSRFTQEEFLQLGLEPEQFSIVTPGVDIDRFQPGKPDSQLVRNYDLEDKQVLLTVARLDERKGHDMVIRAMAELHRDFPQLVYLIVGKGREEDRLRELARENGVSNAVIFCGYVSDEDLPAYYRLCDIFVLLNRQRTDHERLRGDYEGFGIVFLEASACAKPVVAGNFGGIHDAVEDGKSGYVIDGTDLGSITKCFQRLLQNKNLRKELGLYGWKRAEQQFDWQLISQKIRALEKWI